MPRSYEPTKAVASSKPSMSLNQRSRRGPGAKGKNGTRRTVSSRASSAVMEGPETHWEFHKTDTRKKSSEAFIGSDLIKSQADSNANQRDSSAKKSTVATKKSIKTKRTKKSATHQHPKVTPTQPAKRPSVLATSLSSPPSLLNRCALAVDTRALQTVAGDAVGATFLRHVDSFVSSLNRRGAGPCIVASLVADTSKEGENNYGARRSKNSRNTIRAAALPMSECSNGEAINDTCMPGQWKTLLEPVSIPAPLNAGNTKNRQAVHVPKSLLANDSWKFFGDLVETIVTVDAETFGQVRPLDVTILTNDVALLLDTNVESQSRGLDQFWNAVHSSFQNNTVNKVTILVAETGCAALTPDFGVAADPNGGYGSKGGFNDLSTSAQHRLSVTQCVRGIKKQFEEKSNMDFKKRFSTERVTVSTLENSRIAFTELMSKWVTDMVAPHGARRVSFNLPETVDGTQCSVSLDLSHKIMPFRVDSREAQGLRTDIQLLASSEVEVLQLLPLSAVDASLLFGVPMSAKAGMEEDLSHFREMELLVRCLWKYLLEQQVALVLRATCSSLNGNKERQTRSPLYHKEKQTFLLMAEELPGRHKPRSGTAPIETMKKQREAFGANGMLFRYASDEHLLFSPDHTDERGASDETQSESYAEYIENSLECLARDPINPLFLSTLVSDQEEQKEFPKVSSVIEPPPDVEWTDDGGVGTQESFEIQDSSNEGVTAWGDPSHDVFNEFEYE